VFKRKINRNQPFANLEKLMFSELTSFLYARFRGEKQPTSRVEGYVRHEQVCRE
jgi:hypothetical protein